MKNKFIILTFIFMLVFVAGCDNELKNFDSEQKNEITLTREDEIALMHLETEFIRAPEKLIDSVQEYLTLDCSYSQLVITGTESFSKTFNNGFIRAQGIRGPSEIVFYKYTLENQENGKTGYVITCADSRIADIIAVVPEGDWNDENDTFLNFQKAMLEQYIRQTIDTFNKVTQADIKAAQEKLAQLNSNARVSYWGYSPGFDPVYLPEKTMWWSLPYTGGYPFNWAVDYCVRQNANLNNLNWSSGTLYAPGEDVIALAQLVAFHERAGYPAPISSSIKSSYYDTGWEYRGNVYNNHSGYRNPDNTWVSFQKYGTNYNWATIIGVLQPPNPPTVPIDQAAREQIATLIFQTGCRMSKEFTETGSSIVPIELVANALYEMGYRHHGIQKDYSGFNMATSITGIMRSIDEGCPVYVTGYDNDTPQTAFLITGYSEHMSGGLYVRVNAGNGALQTDWVLLYNYFGYDNSLTYKFITGAKPLY